MVELPIMIEECEQDGHSIFKFEKMFSSFYDPYCDHINVGMYLCPKDREALQWISNNFGEKVDFLLNENSDFFKIRFHNQEDASLFKLFWL